MGIRLIVEVLDHSPSTLTHREKLALVVLAESARDRTRECLPGIENDEKVARRMKLPGRSSRYEVIQALRTKGALEIVSGGRKYSRAVYRIAELAAVQRPENPDPEMPVEAPVQGPENLDAEATSQGPGNPDADSRAAEFSGSGNSGFRVRESRTQGPENLDPFPSTPSTPSLKDSLLVAAVVTEPHAPSAPGFEDFYAVYPKKKARPAAEKAWAKAIKAGADAERVIEAARAYAKERRGQDPKFTAYPATWLNGARYDDEPDEPQFPPLRAVAGEYQPWRNPEAEDAYDTDLFGDR